MRQSTKHAIAQRLLALVGFVLFVGPIWVPEFHSISGAVLVTGFVLLCFAIVSGMGIGPWGRYYSSLYVAENDATLISLEPKQPWQK
jgi:hypothetical protein